MMKCINDRSVINRRRSLVDDQQLVKFINIFQPGSRLVRSYLIFSFSRVAKTISLGNIVLMWLLLEAITCCSIDSKNRFWNENETFFEEVQQNDTREMTSCTWKSNNVAFQTLLFEKVQYNEMSYDVMYAENK